MSFQGSSRFTIKGGSFTNMEGTQQVSNVNIQGNLVQYMSQEKRERRIWDEFMQVPLCKIYIKRKVGETDCSRIDLKRKTMRTVNACRTINIVSIQGEDKDLEFLHIAYSGPDASETFQQDFEQFSHVRDVTVAQLFGYNDGQNALPALIFYDALVPVAHIFEQNGFSSLIFTYFQHLVGVTWTVGSKLDFGELWLHPRTGRLCIGPYVDYSGTQFYSASGFKTNSITSNKCPHLPLQIYKDSNALISYLIQTLSIQNIIIGIRWSNRLIREWVPNKDAQFRISFLPGLVYSRTYLEIIAQWPEDINTWYYIPWHPVRLPKEMQENWVDMDDGSVQFPVMPSHIPYLQNQKICFHYDLYPGNKWIKLAESWLLQAHSILSQCGLQRDNMEDYSILDNFWLYLQCEDEQLAQTSSDTSTNWPVYLFLKPVPHPSDPKTVWDSWLQEAKYFWSFDTAGHEEIPKDIQISLGLPSFTWSIEIRHVSWDHVAYDALLRYLCSNDNNSTPLD
uniref:Uncharacterized protein n=1 Tax=Moniliophthora roreri TaxID=221103 RepID=A0A0W0FEA3_MONRR